MPPALKVLSLVTTVLCVVLFFGMLSLDDQITYKSKYPKIIFTPPGHRKNIHETSTSVSGSTTTQKASTIENINIISLSYNGTYFDYLATSSSFLDFNTLERIGGDYYKRADGIYYLLRPMSTCGELKEAKVTKLESSLPNRITQAQRGNFVTDGKDVFVFFYKLASADPDTFSYVGIAQNEGNGVNQTNSYWYKDKNKVFTLSFRIDNCQGFSFSEDANFPAKDVDASTFEYIGFPSGDARTSYAKDKNYFYGKIGRVSDSITPQNCRGDFFKECLPKIQNTTTTSLESH